MNTPEQQAVQLTLTDEQIVDDAIAARAEAEATEEQASPSRWREADAYAELSARGWTQQRIAERCGTTQSSVSRFISAARKYAVPHNRPTFWNAYSEITGEVAMGGLKESVHVEWYTPAPYIEAAREVLGGIDLDPATSPMANETVRASNIYTEAENGLIREWHGRVWLNPPYGQGSGLFATKLVEEHAAGRTTAAILLLNAYGFDSNWFQPLWDHPICFTDHRIQFYSPDRETGGPANANIFVYLGPDRDIFAQTFSQFGAIIARIA